MVTINYLNNYSEPKFIGIMFYHESSTPKFKSFYYFSIAEVESDIFQIKSRRKMHIQLKSFKKHRNPILQKSLKPADKLSMTFHFPHNNKLNIYKNWKFFIFQTKFSLSVCRFLFSFSTTFSLFNSLV